MNWSLPWFASVQDVAQEITAATDWRAGLNLRAAQIALRNHAGLRVSFVDQSELPADMAYEVFVSTTGQVPVRHDLHDLFGSLVWLSFPRIKATLNAIHAKQIEIDGIGSTRGSLRDAATLLDESGALLSVSDSPEGRALVEALRAHRWREVLYEHRAVFDEHARVSLFGHALMQKLAAPYKAITAHVWVSEAPREFFQANALRQRAWLDKNVAREIATGRPREFRPASFTPLPVLGVPGWWDVQDGEFYDDVSVFRPKRTRHRDGPER